MAVVQMLPIGKDRMNVVAAPLKIALPMTLEGSVVRLEPIRREHARLFWEVAKGDAEDIFRWIPYPMKTQDDFERVIAKAFDRAGERSICRIRNGGT